MVKKVNEVLTDDKLNWSDRITILETWQSEVSTKIQTTILDSDTLKELNKVFILVTSAMEDCKLQQVKEN